MISVEMEDVLAVLQLCKPYIIGIIAALVIGIVIMIACRRMSRDKRFLIRGEAVIAMVLAVVVCVNMICFGPMATLIGLATGNGTLSDETNEEAAEAAEEIMELLDEGKSIAMLALGDIGIYRTTDIENVGISGNHLFLFIGKFLLRMSSDVKLVFRKMICKIDNNIYYFLRYFRF